MDPILKYVFGFLASLFVGGVGFYLGATIFYQTLSQRNLITPQTAGEKILGGFKQKSLLFLLCLAIAMAAILFISSFR